jgi:hypothetical protein
VCGDRVPYRRGGNQAVANGRRFPLRHLGRELRIALHGLSHLVQWIAVSVSGHVPHPTRYVATAFSSNFSPSPGLFGSTNWPFSIAGVSS